MNTIRFSASFGKSGVFFVETDKATGLKLKEAGWSYFGGLHSRYMPADLAQKLHDAGVPTHARWVAGSKASTAALLAKSPGWSVSPEAAMKLEGKSKAIEASSATDAECPVDAPPGLEFRPYQRAGIAFAVASMNAKRKGVLIADEMGLGKTIQALGVAIHKFATSTNASPRALIVCPASVRKHWEREAMKWLPGAPVALVSEASDVPASGFAVTNYDRVVGRSVRAKALREALMGQWDLVVFDEAHVLKNPSSQRTVFFLGKNARKGEPRVAGLADGCDFVVALTGTPVQNKAIETLPLLGAIGAIGSEEFPSEWDYMKRFCDAQSLYVSSLGREVWNFDGSSNLDDLYGRLRSGWMVRRLKKDVAKELPPKIRTFIEIATDGDGEDLDSLDAEDVVTIPFTEIAAYRARLAVRKSAAAVEHIRSLLEGGVEKLLVFAHHKALLDTLEQELGGFGVIRIDGEVSPDKRQALVDDFQAGTPRVAVLGHHAAGVGLTLTAASWVVFVEADWNPMWCLQAEDRAHRIGTTADAVNIQYLVAADSLDQRVVATMLAKMGIADQALDVAPVEVSPSEIQPSAPGEAPARESETRVSGVEYHVTEDVTAAAIEALLLLSSHCDGAVTDDATGFNGRDARSDFVQSLVGKASSGILSRRDTAWALKVLRTYSKTQVGHLAARLYPLDAEKVPAAKTPKPPKSSTPAAEKSLKALEFLAGNPGASAAQIASALGLEGSFAKQSAIATMNGLVKSGKAVKVNSEGAPAAYSLA